MMLSPILIQYNSIVAWHQAISLYLSILYELSALQYFCPGAPFTNIV